MLIAAASFGVSAMLSLVLLWGSRGSSGLPGCGSGTACEAVTRGRWSRIGSIPVSAPGLLLYLTLAAAAASAPARPSNQLQVCQQGLLQAGAALALGAAVWFLGLQALVLRQFCMYCTAAHAFAICGSLVALAGGNSAAGQPMGCRIAGGAVLVLLVVAQVVLPPRMFAVTRSTGRIDDGRVPGPPDVAPDGAPEATPLPSRTVQLMDGRVTLRCEQWPFQGSRTADHVLAFLFDHTCGECQHLHRLLVGACAHYAGRLGVAMIPVPMHSGCNPRVKCKDIARGQACAYARLGLAVHVASPALYATWDSWVAGSQEQQPFGLAVQKATQLADISRFNIAEADPALDATILNAVEVYERAGAGNLPGLLLPRGVLHGHVPSEAAMIRVLDRHLNLASSSVSVPST